MFTWLAITSRMERRMQRRGWESDGELAWGENEGG
jgi:hypothetical protein